VLPDALSCRRVLRGCEGAVCDGWCPHACGCTWELSWLCRRTSASRTLAGVLYSRRRRLRVFRKGLGAGVQELSCCVKRLWWLCRRRGVIFATYRTDGSEKSNRPTAEEDFFLGAGRHGRAWPPGCEGGEQIGPREQGGCQENEHHRGNGARRVGWTRVMSSCVNILAFFLFFFDLRASGDPFARRRIASANLVPMRRNYHHLCHTLRSPTGTLEGNIHQVFYENEESLTLSLYVQS